MSRKRGDRDVESGDLDVENSREICHVAFPVVDYSGTDRLFYVYGKARLGQPANPVILAGPDDVIRRMRGVELVHDPPYTFFDTIPPIGRNTYIDGHSLDLAFILADRMVRYGFSETRTIVATGCLPGHDGVVGLVGEFERKLALLWETGLCNFLFIFPRANLVESVEDTIRRLKKERNVECWPIERLDELQFLWQARPVERHPIKRKLWRWLAACVTALAVLVVGCVVLVFFTPDPQPPPLDSPDIIAGAAERRINTAGENGAYHGQFCPPVRNAMARLYFPYWCAQSTGTVENISRVREFPTNISFGQLDVYANEVIKQVAEFKKLTVIRTDACEGLWMVTRSQNQNLTNYEDVRGRAHSEDVQDRAHQIRFILPKDSGSAASFAFLQANDPKGLGRVSNVQKHEVENATEVLKQTADSPDEAVGFFVQFADPENTNMKLIAEKGLKIIPVTGKEVLAIPKLDGDSVYQEKTFKIKSGGVFDIFDIFATKVTTACTPLAIITGNPDAFTGRDEADDQRALVAKIRQVSKNLPPHNSRIVPILIYAKRLATQTLEAAGTVLTRIRQMTENRSQ